MRVVHESHPNAQEAITDYKVLGSSVLGELDQNVSALLLVRTGILVTFPNTSDVT